MMAELVLDSFLRWPKIILESRGTDGTAFESESPMTRRGTDKKKLVRGPATPISKSCFLRVIRDFILINAPKVPMRFGKGMK